MVKRLLLFAIIVLCVKNESAAQIYTLRNQNILIGIDENAALVSLVNLHTGHNYASGKPLWRLYFDTHNEKDIMFLATDNLPEIKTEKSKITIYYNTLKNKEKEFNFTLSLVISLEEDKIRFESKMFNNEMNTVIRELQYPLVGNCLYPEDHQLLTTQRGGHKYSDPKKKIQSMNFSYRGPDHHFRQLNILYPVGVSSNCFALAGNEQGLYFGSHDTTFRYTCHGIRLYPDKKGDFNELETGLYKYPDCLPGETWSNNSNVIAPYNGSWHQTSRLYRTWADTWWAHNTPPLWVKMMPGFQRVILRHQNGETLFTYDDFSGRIKQAGRSAGINVTFPFGWWNSGMDNGYPDSYYLTDPEQGGDEAWSRAVNDYKKDGGKVIMYFNGKLIDTESDYYTYGEGKQVSYKSSTGIEMTEAYKFPGEGTYSGFFNPRSFVVADTRDPKWQKKLIEMADRTIELGGDCVFYDQLGYAESATNWDIGKEFPVLRQEIIYDKANALKMIHGYIDEIDPELAIGTEWITDVTSQYVDFVHGIFGMGSATGSTHANFIDWFRYTFPEVIISNRDIDGDEPDVEWLTNRSVLFGLRSNLQIFRLRGLIDETNRYRDHLAKINELTQMFSEFLFLGTYRDTEGFTINNMEISARSYLSGNKIAIVMTHDKKKTVTTDLVVTGYHFKEADGVGEINLIQTADNKHLVSVGQNGLAVLVFQKN